jgi:hypothetical protein
MLDIFYLTNNAVASIETANDILMISDTGFLLSQE